MPNDGRCPDCGKLYSPVESTGDEQQDRERRPLELPPEGDTWTPHKQEEEQAAEQAAESPSSAPGSDTASWDTDEFTGLSNEAASSVTVEGETEEAAGAPPADKSQKTIQDADHGTVEWETEEAAGAPSVDEGQKTIQDAGHGTVEWETEEAAGAPSEDEGQKAIQDAGHGTVEWETEDEGASPSGSEKTFVDDNDQADEGAGKTIRQADPTPSNATVNSGATSAGGEMSPPDDEEQGTAGTIEFDGTLVDSDRAGRKTEGEQGLTDVPEDKTDPKRRDMTAVWGDSAEGGRPGMTIRAESTPIGAATRLTIRPREVAHVENRQDTPSDYELLKILGQGGMGVVYMARQSSINRTVALKMLKGKDASAKEKDKFLAEAIVTGDLDHPNIVPIYDLGSNKDGALFYSMKRVKGTPWSDAIGEKSQAENLEILMKVCDAVAFAHARGVVHRDIKPENVMLGDFGEVLVLDWGIAISDPLLKEMGADPSKTSMGGTPAYMAPEMATGPANRIGAHSDIYLLGATLYEVLTNQPPHTGRNVMACLKAAAKNEIRPTTVTSELLDIAMQAMETDQDDRYATVQEFQDAIRQFQSHSESISLCTLADEDLGVAKKSKDYQDFARAVYGYEQSLALWGENRGAHDGISRAQHAWASCAHEKGDYELGLSLLDSNQAEHEELVAQLREAQAEREGRQNRLASLKRIAVGLVACLLIGAVVSSAVIAGFWRQALLARDEAKLAEAVALDAEALAEERREEAVTEKNRAIDQEKRADAERVKAVAAEKVASEARDAAVEAKNEADEARYATEVAKQREEEAAYKAEIQLAAERIRDNAISNAVELLDGQLVGAKKKFRHWEWGRLRYLCDLAQHTFDADDQSAGGIVGAVAVSADENRMAVGHLDGSINIYQRDEQSGWKKAVQLGQLDANWPVHALAFGSAGEQLAVGGGNPGEGIISLWTCEPSTEADYRVSQTWDEHANVVTSLSFTQDGGQLLSSSQDATARIFDLQSENPARVFRGHFDAIWHADFSADEALIVTASEDATVRVWAVGTETEIFRFTGHDGPVLAADFAPDSSRVASGGDDRRVLVWELNETVRSNLNPDRAEARREFRANRVDLIRRALAGETLPQPRVREFLGHTGQIRTVRFSADGELLLSGSDDHTLKVWDALWDTAAAETGKSPLRQHLLTRADVEDVPSGLLVTLRGHGSWISSSDWSQNGATIFSGSFDTTARSWDLATYAELLTMPGPQRPVLGAALSPQGTYVAAAYDDGSARIWTRDGEQIAEIKTLREGHEFMASNVAFMQAGNRVLTAAGDNTVRVWDTRRGTEIAAVLGTGQRGVLAAAQEGDRFLTGSNEKFAVLRKLDGDRVIELARLDHTQKPLAELSRAFPDATKENLAARLPAVASAAFAPQGKAVVVGDTKGGCWLWDLTQLDSGKMLEPKQFAGHAATVNAVGFTDKYAVTASADSTVAFWDLAQVQEVGKRLKHDYPVTHLTISADKRYLLTASALRTQVVDSEEVASEAAKRVSRVYLKLWKIDLDQPMDAPEQELELTLPDGQAVERVNSLAFSPDGMSAMVACSVGIRDHLLRWEFDPKTPQAIRPFWELGMYRGPVSAAIFSPQDEIVTVGGRGARLWTQQGKGLRTFRPHREVTSIAFSPDESFVVTSSSDGSAKVWVFADSKPTAICKLEQLQPDAQGLQGHLGPVNQASFHPRTGKDVILTAGQDGTAKLWKFDRDQRTVSVIASLDGHESAVMSAVFSRQGDRVLTVSQDKTARIWEVGQANRVLRQLVHPSPVLCGNFSADGQWVVTGAADNQARVWRVADGMPLVQFSGHSAPVTAVDFSDDRQRLLTTSRDQLAKLWDAKIIWDTERNRQLDPEGVQSTFVEERQDILNLDAHDGDVVSGQFSHDGRAILTAAIDGRIHLWLSRDVTPALLLSLGVQNYTQPGTNMAIDPLALVRVPNTTDLAQCVVTCQLLGPIPAGLAGQESLTVGDTETEIRLAGTNVLFGSDDLEVVIGKVQETQPDRVVITLTADADGLALEALIRSCMYRANAELPNGAIRQVKFELDFGENASGNQSTQKTIQLGS